MSLGYCGVLSTGSSPVAPFLLQDHCSKRSEPHSLWLTLLPGALCDPALPRLQPAAICHEVLIRTESTQAPCLPTARKVEADTPLLFIQSNMGVGRQWSFLESYMPLWLCF